MIDTVKIFTYVDKNVYDKVCSNSIIKTSFHTGTGELFYNIVNDHLKGSFDNSISVRVDTSDKYSIKNKFILVIEGSFHKVMLGQNAFDGFYDLELIVNGFKSIVENAYNISLPDYDSWYLKRVDIAKCFDFKNQQNVINFINNLKFVDYPRRQFKHFLNTGLYFSGTTTTLKIYNKLLEFNKNDRFKLLKNPLFDVDSFLKKIDGFCRFEVEIKNKKLQKIFYKKNGAILTNLKCSYFKYEDFESVWVDEFMKVIKLKYTDLKYINNKNLIYDRLVKNFGCSAGNDLYNFYLSILVDGYKNVKFKTSKSTFYRKIKILKDLGIDFSTGHISVINNSDKTDFTFFDIFNMCEVV